MKRLLLLRSSRWLCVVAGTALGQRRQVEPIYDSTNPNRAPTNQPSYGPQANSFATIRDKISFAPDTARSLTNVTVTLCSWGKQGNWDSKDCVTQAGATFSQPMTLTI
jgi:hypothetical protein